MQQHCLHRQHHPCHTPAAAAAAVKRWVCSWQQLGEWCCAVDQGGSEGVPCRAWKQQHRQLVQLGCWNCWLHWKAGQRSSHILSKHQPADNSSSSTSCIPMSGQADVLLGMLSQLESLASSAPAAVALGLLVGLCNVASCGPQHQLKRRCLARLKYRKEHAWQAPAGWHQQQQPLMQPRVWAGVGCCCSCCTASCARIPARAVTAVLCHQSVVRHVAVLCRCCCAMSSGTYAVLCPAHSIAASGSRSAKALVAYGVQCHVYIMAWHAMSGTEVGRGVDGIDAMA
jgi:hypothetical protein